MCMVPVGHLRQALNLSKAAAGIAKIIKNYQINLFRFFLEIFRKMTKYYVRVAAPDAAGPQAPTDSRYFNQHSVGLWSNKPG